MYTLEFCFSKHKQSHEVDFLSLRNISLLLSLFPILLNTVCNLKLPVTRSDHLSYPRVLPCILSTAPKICISFYQVYPLAWLSDSILPRAHPHVPRNWYTVGFDICKKPFSIWISSSFAWWMRLSVNGQIWSILLRIWLIHFQSCYQFTSNI